MKNSLEIQDNSVYTDNAMKKKKNKRGRPRKNPADKYSERLLIKMTPAERKRLDCESKKTGISLAGLLMRPWRKGQK